MVPEDEPHVTVFFLLIAHINCEWMELLDEDEENREEEEEEEEEEEALAI